MLDEDLVLQHGDLGAVLHPSDDHDPFDAFPTGEELRLGDDRRAPPSGIAALPPSLPLGLQARGALDRSHLVLAGLVLAVVRSATTAASAPATLTARRLGVPTRLFGVRLCGRIAAGLLGGLRLVLGRLLLLLSPLTIACRGRLRVDLLEVDLGGEEERRGSDRLVLFEFELRFLLGG